MWGDKETVGLSPVLFKGSKTCLTFPSRISYSLTIRTLMVGIEFLPLQVQVDNNAILAGAGWSGLADA